MRSAVAPPASMWLSVSPVGENTSIEYVGTTRARWVVRPSERSTIAGDENQPVSVGRFQRNTGFTTGFEPSPFLQASVSSMLPSVTTLPPGRLLHEETNVALREKA